MQLPLLPIGFGCYYHSGTLESRSLRERQQFSIVGMIVVEQEARERKYCVCKQQAIAQFPTQKLSKIRAHSAHSAAQHCIAQLACARARTKLQQPALQVSGSQRARELVLARPLPTSRNSNGDSPAKASRALALVLAASLPARARARQPALEAWQAAANKLRALVCRRWRQVGLVSPSARARFGLAGKLLAASTVSGSGSGRTVESRKGNLV